MYRDSQFSEICNDKVVWTYEIISFTTRYCKKQNRVHEDSLRQNEIVFEILDIE